MIRFYPSASLQPADTWIRRRETAEHTKDVLGFISVTQRTRLECGLAVVVDAHGPSPRKPGAMIGVSETGEYAGYVSNGCIDHDIVRQLLDVMQDGHARRVRYGAGSPYQDVRLPCGGGLELLLVPNPDKEVVSAALGRFAVREPVVIGLHADNTPAFTVLTGGGPVDYRFRYAPPLRILIAGKGAETIAFIKLAAAAGYELVGYSPEDEVLDACTKAGCDAQRLRSTADAVQFRADPWTAIVCMFHDHEWEMNLLTAALETPAFYIGAMGGRKTQVNRLDELRACGAAEASLARIHGPIGLIASMREASGLAVSALAEIVDRFPDATAR